MMQAIQIEIPQDVMMALKIPQQRIKATLTEELAVDLYAQGYLSFLPLTNYKCAIGNSSPLMNLAIIGQLELVKTLFGRVFVPQEVWHELTVAGICREKLIH